MGLTANTINRYLFFLKEAFLVHERAVGRELPQKAGSFTENLHSGFWYFASVDSYTGFRFVAWRWQNWCFLGRICDRADSSGSWPMCLSLLLPYSIMVPSVIWFRPQMCAPEIAIEIKYSLQPAVSKAFETIWICRQSETLSLFQLAIPIHLRRSCGNWPQRISGEIIG